MKMCIPIVQSTNQTGTRYAISILPEWCRIISSVVLPNVGKGALLLSVVLLIGCEEDLASHSDTSKPFTMYGVLSPDLDTQSVHVYVPEKFPTLGSSAELDVEVFSTDLESGERRTWTDSLIVQTNGQHEHVFWAPFRAEFDREYRIEAVRSSNGARSYADVRIPPPVTVRIKEETAPLLQVFVEGEDVRVLQPEFEYIVGSPQRSAGEFSITVDYSAREQQVEEGWKVVANMIVDYEEIRFIVRADNRCRQVLALDTLKLHALVGDVAWDPPGGIFDANVLAVPDRMANVENGFGFIGGGYRIAELLFPSREAVESACFVYRR